MSEKAPWITYRPELKVLDCTIRDGGLVNKHQFSDDFVRAVYETCIAAGIDCMEVGYKNSAKLFPADEFGPWRHCEEDDLNRVFGGHDPEKVYAAMKAAVEHRGSPTVILAKTVKGYGLGEAGEGRNITHQQKKLNEAELREFRSRFGIPISDEDVGKAPFYRPPEDSPEMVYLRERRKSLGGFVPRRAITAPALSAPPLESLQELLEGTEGREVSTTMAFVRALTKLIKMPEIGGLIAVAVEQIPIGGGASSGIQDQAPLRDRLSCLPDESLQMVAGGVRQSSPEPLAESHRHDLPSSLELSISTLSSVSP